MDKIRPAFNGNLHLSINICYGGTSERIKVTEAEVVYVAVDANRRKMRIPENIKELFDNSGGD